MRRKPPCGQGRKLAAIRLMGTDSHLQPQARCLVINWHNPDTAFTTTGAENPLSQPERVLPGKAGEPPASCLFPDGSSWARRQAVRDQTTPTQGSAWPLAAGRGKGPQRGRPLLPTQRTQSSFQASLLGTPLPISEQHTTRGPQQKAGPGSSPRPPLPPGLWSHV